MTPVDWTGAYMRKTQEAAHTASEEVSSAHVAMASDADRRYCPEEDENKGGLERALHALTRLTIDVGSYADGTNALLRARRTRGDCDGAIPEQARPIEALFAASGHSDSLKLLPIAVSNQTGSLAFYVSTQQGTRSSIIQNGATGSEQDQLDQPPWPSTRVEVPVSTSTRSSARIATSSTRRSTPKATTTRR